MRNRRKSPGATLTGDDLLGMFASAQACLSMHAAQVDALNVFPVPDGDTGANMSLTMKAVEDKLAGQSGKSAGAVAAVFAREAMMGARGNSGVILSQFFAGIAKELEGRETFGVKEMAAALRRASEEAYKAVSKPVEGTMLTVVRLAADAALRALAEGEETPSGLWSAACQGARDALAQTPELLPVLKEAGVVDAGGLGIVALMEGARAYLMGLPPAPLDIEIGRAAPTPAYLTATAEDAFGYCTQFLLEGQGLVVDSVRRRLEEISNSTIAVGDGTAIKVHAHALDPGALLSYAVALGRISQVKIENMDLQHQGFMDMHRRQGDGQARAPVAVVAVAAGLGIERIFQEYGVVAIVQGGQTMNPSARDLLEAAEQANAGEVILLPNNPNIVGTARQAAALAQKPVHVLPTTSIPQGIAALLAFAPESDAASNLAHMGEALKRVRSCEVTRAVRSVRINGVMVREGQAIALLDGDLVAAAETPLAALEALCGKVRPAAGSLLTLYWGAGTTETEAAAAAERLRACNPGIEVEVVHGGQPHYDYLAAIE
ncbi:MAG: DAK2 domain-containing protein [Chloroflexi bacterium]|nr:DAK2 domain-containing protein [Chloroflexota bacterium]